MGEGHEEFRAFFLSEYEPTVRRAFLVLGVKEAAEDVTQEAFAQLYRHWRRVSRYEQPGAWVRRVAIRLAARQARRDRRTVPLAGPGGADHAQALDVRRAVLTLPARQRVAVVLHYFDGLPVADIAQALGCSTSTAKVHLHRARKRLADLLGENEIEEAPDVAR